MKRQAMLAGAALATILGTSAFAQSSLENPQPSSYQSGIGIISGWSCVSNVQVLIDGSPLAVAYGTPRADVTSTCAGNPNVGFGLLINYNTLGGGTHTAQLKVGGTNVGAPIQFTVTVPAGEFPLGLSGSVTITGFPSATQSTTLQWQQSQQNFAITNVATIGGTGGFPITFKGMRLDGITTAAGVSGTCDATLAFTNTSTDSHTAIFYFDVLQGGIVKDQVVFNATSVAAAAAGQDTKTVTINSNIAACGTFTLQFNTTNSDVFTP
jgi:hypothetical protein